MLTNYWRKQRKPLGREALLRCRVTMTAIATDSPMSLMALKKTFKHMVAIQTHSFCEHDLNYVEFFIEIAYRDLIDNNTQLELFLRRSATPYIQHRSNRAD